MERHQYLRPTFVIALGAVLIGIGLCMFTPQSVQAVSVKACPALPVKITGLEVTPRQAARQHTVKVTWAVSSPECFTIQRFEIKGKLTFANGQSKSFAQSVGGNESSLEFQVPGFCPSLAQWHRSKRRLESPALPQRQSLVIHRHRALSAMLKRPSARVCPWRMCRMFEQSLPGCWSHLKIRQALTSPRSK